MNAFDIKIFFIKFFFSLSVNGRKLFEETQTHPTMFSNVKVFGTKDLNPANVLLRNFQDSGSMGNKDNHNIQ